MRFPVVLTVLGSKVALTRDNLVGVNVMEATDVFKETSFPICTIKLSVVMAGDGFCTFCMRIVRL